MNKLKYILALMLIGTNVSAGNLQNSDFATAAQITGAGGTIAQLLNDSKIYISSNGLNEQLTTALTNGDIATASNFFDTNFAIKNAAVNSKQMKFSLGGATAATTTTFTLVQTANRSLTFPDLTDFIVSRTSTDTLTNKSIDATTNTLSNIANVSIAAAGVANIARNKFAAGGLNNVVVNDGAGVMTDIAQIAITQGGTGQSTALAAFNALSPLTTKGDILGRTVANNIRVPVGADGFALVADSTQAAGIKWAATAGVGTVTSVALADGSGLPIYTISGSPVVGAGTLTFTLSNENANLVFAGPNGGGPAQPTFRALVAADINAALPVTTKGDLLTYSVSPTRLPVGADGTVLSADSTQATGLKWIAGAGTGTVTSVALADGSGTPIYTISGSPVTTNGTLTFTLSNEVANTVFAGPNGGGPAQPTFRALVPADIPALDFSKITTGTVPIAQGGTGQVTATAAFNALSPLTTLGDTLYHNGVNNVRLPGNTTAVKQFLSQTGTGAVSAAPVWGALVAADIPNLDFSKITTGIVPPVQGGTGIANGATLTYGASNITLTTSGVTSLTLPTAGTLATLAGVETFSNKTYSDAITFTELATPANPPAGTDKCYPKADHKWYCLSSAGVETLIGPAGGGGGGGSLNAKWCLNDAVVPYVNIDGPHYVSSAVVMNNIYVSELNSGTSGSTVIQINQYTAGVLAATATASLASAAGAPAGSFAALSGALNLNVGDLLTIDVNSIAGGAPEAICVEY